jgi:soluble P-type ATPase
MIEIDVPGVRERLLSLAPDIEIIILTADTFGMAAEHLNGIPCRLVILEGGDQQEQKAAFIHDLGLQNAIAIGNGLNNAKMLTNAGLGIAVIQKEGASFDALKAADIVTSDILDALDLLAQPLRMKATLRT